MKRFAVFGVLALLMTANEVQGITVTGPTDCGQWLHDRSYGGGVTLQTQMWILGYLSGLAVATNTEFFNANGRYISNDQIYYWMDDYCKTHPLAGIADAGSALFDTVTFY